MSRGAALWGRGGGVRTILRAHTSLRACGYPPQPPPFTFICDLPSTFHIYPRPPPPLFTFMYDYPLPRCSHLSVISPRYSHIYIYPQPPPTLHFHLWLPLPPLFTFICDLPSIRDTPQSPPVFHFHLLLPTHPTPTPHAHERILRSEKAYTVTSGVFAKKAYLQVHIWCSPQMYIEVRFQNKPALIKVQKSNLLTSVNEHVFINTKG